MADEFPFFIGKESSEDKTEQRSSEYDYSNLHETDDTFKAANDVGSGVPISLRYGEPKSDITSSTEPKCSFPLENGEKLNKTDIHSDIATSSTTQDVPLTIDVERNDDAVELKKNLIHTCREFLKPFSGFLLCALGAI